MLRLPRLLLTFVTCLLACVAPAASPGARASETAGWYRSGLDGTALQTLAVDPNDPGTVYAGGDGLYRSDDGGATWLTIDPTMRVQELAISPVNPLIVYAGYAIGCARGDDGETYRTSDGGATWIHVPGNLRSYVPSTRRQFSLLAADCGGVISSRDGGNSWVLLEDANPWRFDVLHVVPAPSDPNVVYVVAASEGGTAVVSRSPDGGGAWQEALGVDAQAFGPVDLVVQPTDPATALLVVWSGPLRTADGGATWQPAATGLDDIRQDDNGFVTYRVGPAAWDPAEPEVVYLGAGDGSTGGLGVYRSADAGQSWAWAGDGLGATLVRGLLVTADRVLAATPDGIWALDR